MHFRLAKEPFFFIVRPEVLWDDLSVFAQMTHRWQVLLSPASGTWEVR